MEKGEYIIDLLRLLEYMELFPYIDLQSDFQGKRHSLKRGQVEKEDLVEESSNHTSIHTCWSYLTR